MAVTRPGRAKSFQNGTEPPWPKSIQSGWEAGSLHGRLAAPDVCGSAPPSAVATASTTTPRRTLLTVDYVAGPLLGVQGESTSGISSASANQRAEGKALLR